MLKVKIHSYGTTLETGEVSGSEKSQVCITGWYGFYHYAMAFTSVLLYCSSSSS